MEICRRVKEIAAVSEHDVAVLRSLYYLWTFLAANGHLTHSYEIASQLAESARASGHELFLRQAAFAQGVTLIHQGRAHQAIEPLSKALELRDSTQQTGGFHLDPAVSCRCNRARAYWLTGYPEKSVRDSRTALAQAKELDHPATLAYAFAMAADIAHFRGETRQVLNFSERALELADQHDLAFQRIMARVLRGWALAEVGRFQEASACFGPHVLEYRGPAVSKFVCLMARVLVSAGRRSDAKLALECIEKLQPPSEEVYFNAEILRLQGELLVGGPERRPGDYEAGVSCFRRAIRKAHQQGARSLALRAALSMARFSEPRHRQGATRNLAREYAAFDEGFDTSDLTEVRNWLEGTRETAHLFD